jgi:hypothetical protein
VTLWLHTFLASQLVEDEFPAKLPCLFFSVISGEKPGWTSDSGDKRNIPVATRNKRQSGKLRKYSLLRRDCSHILKYAPAGKGETN